jgi:quercetin dioxygenase-like cupin family protein
MEASALQRHPGGTVDLGSLETIALFGPTIRFLTAPEGSASLMHGTIPPGGIVPLHSHPDPETYIGLSGEVEALLDTAGRLQWQRIGQGDIFHVPGGAKHAFRNRSRAPSVMLIISTQDMARFFRTVGTAENRPPSPAELRHFLETATCLGHWNASPEENAAVGVPVPAEFRPA